MSEKKTPNLECHLCDKPAVGRFSPDMDISGLAFCEKHRDLIGVAFYCLMTDNIEDFDAIMGTNIKKDIDEGPTK